MNQVVAELVQEIQQGNEEKMIELWEKFRPLWTKWSRRYQICGYEIEDLQQQSYMLLLEGTRHYDATRGVPFEGYYQLILKRWALGELRKKKNQPMADLGELEECLADEGMNVEREVELQLQVEALQKALGNLAREEQMILVGFYMERRSLGELAQMLGMSYKAIEKRKATLLGRLRGNITGTLNFSKQT